MTQGFPQIGFVGLPLAVPCAGHAGLGFRAAGPADGPAVLAHLRALDPTDRRMRFLGAVSDFGLERHVERLWQRPGPVIAAHDGRPGAAAVRALAELAIDGTSAEIALTVDAGLRGRGVGSHLLGTAARLLARRGVARIRAYTLPENAAFLALARRHGAAIGAAAGELRVDFDVAAVLLAHLRRAAPVLQAAG